MGNTDAVTVSKEIQLLRLSIKLVNKHPEVQRKYNLKIVDFTKTRLILKNY